MASLGMLEGATGKTIHDSGHRMRNVSLPIASHPGEREHPPRNNNILVPHWRNEPPRRGQLGHHLVCRMVENLGRL
jgi:hypothetical protein